MFQQGSRSCSYTRNERGWARNTRANAQRTSKCDEYLTMWSVSNVETDTYNHLVENSGGIKSCFDTWYRLVKEFGYAEKQQERGGYIQSSPAAYVQAWVTAPLKQSRPLQPQSRRITSGRDGGEADCIQNELTSFRYLLRKKKKKRVAIKTTESGHVQRCSTHCIKGREPNDFANVSTSPSGNFTLEFRDEGELVCVRFPWNEPLLATTLPRCGQVSFPGWNGEYGSVLPQGGRLDEGRRGVCSMWFQGTICLRWEWEVVDLQGTWR